MSSKAKKQESGVILDLWVPFRMWRIANRIGQDIHTVYHSEFQISRAAWRALLVLANCAPLSAGDLAERSGMDPTRVSQAMKELEKRRYINRRPDPNDRRKTILRLTPSGERLFGQIAPHAKIAEEQLMAALTKQEEAVFLTILSKMENHIESVYGKNGPET